MMKYNPKEIEKKYREEWEKSEIYKAQDKSTKPKYYCLNEFPYPSGSGIHVGHVFTYIGGDVYARFKRMQGLNVLFPMGWDAFGLPAENYAIKVKKTPQVVVPQNISAYKEVMGQIGLSFDWSREINTTDPSYYKWTQWIFLKLFEKGLAYKEERPINWCPSCKIGLADEEVINGKCERCGTQTERRNISQWIVKITDYADRLIDGLKDTDFIGKVKAAQINWIDRKEWIDITYEIKGIKDTVTVATTRPDTNFGATFIVLAPEHEIVSKLISGKIETKEDLEKIKGYVKAARNKSELDRQKEVTGRDKTGVFTGLYAVNQLSGKKMPIWITDFVLSSVGTGAVVGVPGHDTRDYEFAKQFGLEIIRVVVGKDREKGEITDKSQVQEHEGVMINSGFLDGMDIHKATKKVMDYLEEKGWGKKSIRYHLRDWIFSRQHYWGEPIPMVNCEKCGWVPVDEKDLPVILPEVEHYEPTDTGESPLANIASWVNATCPKCKGKAKRETDTMPNWAGSDWYFIRYLDSSNTREIADVSKQRYWLPVDVYIGGDEHNTLHLLYSRFINQFLFDLGVVPISEPYKKRISHGVILGPNNQRMSKSKGNIITPKDTIEKVGADSLRTYLMFMGPFDATMSWNDHSQMGVKRFYDRVYEYITENINNFAKESKQEIAKAVSKTIKEVGERIESFQYNIAIAKFMELINFLEKTSAGDVGKGDIESFVLMLAPFGPFITEQLWRELGHKESVHTQLWPKYSDNLLCETEIEIPIQVNGKVRGKIKIPVQLSQEDVRKTVEKNESIVKSLEGKTIKKFIYIPGKIVNVVI
ncbi:leucine--tRNA ligase [Candidatus Dojkabacteria bacterium]|nr:leucine--tRNA ligase [Candidatus Dojkabacteria bacterium]